LDIEAALAIGGYLRVRDDEKVSAASKKGEQALPEVDPNGAAKKVGKSPVN
jgi:hypothetical protein